MTLTINGQAFDDNQKLVQVADTVGEGGYKRVSLSPHYTDAGLEMDDVPSEVAAHVIFSGMSDKLNQIVVQLYSDGEPLAPEAVDPQRVYGVCENQSLRVVGPKSPEGTSVLEIGYQRGTTTDRSRR